MSQLDDRDRMVSEQIEARGIREPELLAAFRRVPRHAFVPDGQLLDAYKDRPLPIGLEQTISQPYMVAIMTELLQMFRQCSAYVRQPSRLGKRDDLTATNQYFHRHVYRTVNRRNYLTEICDIRPIRIADNLPIEPVNSILAGR